MAECIESPESVRDIVIGPRCLEVRFDACVEDIATFICECLAVAIRRGVVGGTASDSGLHVQPAKEGVWYHELVPSINTRRVEVVRRVVHELMPEISGGRFTLVVDGRATELLAKGTQLDFREAFNAFVEIIDSRLSQKGKGKIIAKLFDFKERTGLGVKAMIRLEEISVDVWITQLIE